MPLSYNIYRALEGSTDFERITEQPVTKLSYQDTHAAQDATFAYTIRSVNRRGIESPSIPAVTASALPEIREPVFACAFIEHPDGMLYNGEQAPGTMQGKAHLWRDALDLRRGGHVTYDYRPEYGVSNNFSVECWVQTTEETQMPVILSCGEWNKGGWFLQQLGGQWRWYVGGISCDGGKLKPRTNGRTLPPPMTALLPGFTRMAASSLKKQA